MKTQFNIARYMMSLFSILLSSICVYFFIYQLFENIYISITLALLTIPYEYFYIKVLTYSFKEIYNKKIIRFLVFFLLSLILIGGSFVLTASGSKEIIDWKKDKSVIIENKKELEINSISNHYDILIKENIYKVDSLVNTPLPLLYSAKKIHMQYIDLYSNRTSELKLEKEQKIKEISEKEVELISDNELIVSKLKTENYIISIVIMSCIFLFNLIYIYFCVQERKKIAKTQYKFLIKNSKKIINKYRERKYEEIFELIK